MNLTMPACRSQSTAGGRQRPYRNTALRDGARTSTRTSSVAKGRTASIHCRPAPPRQPEALSSRTSRSRPWKRRSQAVRERKTTQPRQSPSPLLRLRIQEPASPPPPRDQAACCPLRSRVRTHRPPERYQQDREGRDVAAPLTSMVVFIHGRKALGAFATRGRARP